MSAHQARRYRVDRRLVTAGLAACLFAPAVQARPKPISFGLTPVFLDSDLRLTRDIESYLSARLARPVALVKRRTYMEITSLLVAGHVDAAWICGLPFVQHRAQLEILAVPLYRGAPQYRSYLITGTKEDIQAPAELRGGIHAFSDPESNSGHLVTRAWLADQGESPASFFSRVFFAYGHRNVIRAVAAGLARSGSVDSYVWEVMQETEPNLVDATRVIWRSPEMGFPPVAASRRADPEVTRALQSALIDMPNDPTGRNVLATLRLDGFSIETPELFDGIAVLWHRVGAAG
jgi:phosphate/phosphite/phosphonate ABC transporter binding protein